MIPNQSVILAHYVKSKGFSISSQIPYHNCLCQFIHSWKFRISVSFGEHQLENPKFHTNNWFCCFHTYFKNNIVHTCTLIWCNLIRMVFDNLIKCRHAQKKTNTFFSEPSKVCSRYPRLSWAVKLMTRLICRYVICHRSHVA